MLDELSIKDRLPPTLVFMPRLASFVPAAMRANVAGENFESQGGLCRTDQRRLEARLALQERFIQENNRLRRIEVRFKVFLFGEYLVSGD